MYFFVNIIQCIFELSIRSMSADKLLRLELLKEVCRKRGWTKPDGSVSPSKLAEAIDRKVNQCSDILNGRASFGEDLARHIEERLGLGKWALDGGAGWPFPHLDRAEFDELEPWQKTEVQGLVRDKIASFRRVAPEKPAKPRASNDRG